MQIRKNFGRLSLGILAALLLVPLISAQAAVLPLANSSFEDQGATRQEAITWFPFQNGYTRTTAHHTGSWGIMARTTNTASFAGAYQRIDLNQTELKPVLVEGYVRGASIVNAAGGWFGAGIYAEIVMNDGSVAYWNSLPNYGSFNWRWIGFNTGVLASVNKPISHIFVVPIIGQAKGTAYFDDIKVTEFDPYQSAVSIIIDDGEESTYTEAKPALDAHNFDASVAIPSGTVGDEEHMDKTQLLALQSSGWEIMSHGINHEDLTLMSAAKASSEFATSKRQLERMGFTVKNFAFPFGAYNANLIYRGLMYYRSMRPYELGDNPQGVFTPHEPKIRSVVSTTSLAEISAWLDSAKANDRWVILNFHSIATTGEDVYHTTPVMFKNIMDLVASKGMPVVTYDHGLDLFGATQ